jgi:exopolysaccharide biosynthesis polyprenyl glycosylphosphotransferase
MIKPSRKIYPAYFLVDSVIILFAFYTSYYFRYNSLVNFCNFQQIQPPYLQEHLFIFTIWFILIMVAFKRRGLYATDRGLIIPKEIFRVVISILYTGIFVGAIVFFAKFKFFSRQVFFSSFFSLCFLLSGWRAIKKIILRKLIAKGFHNFNVVIAGAGKMGRFVLSQIRQNPWWGFKVVGFLDDYKDEPVDNVPVLGKLTDLANIAKRHFIEELIITIPSERENVSRLINFARDKRIGVRILPDSFFAPLPKLSVDYLGLIPVLTYKERKPHPAGLALKRLFDFVLSLVLLIILLPLLLTIAVLIKATSRGPVFHIQERVGFKGKHFNFYKFRSMVKDAELLKTNLADKNEVKDGIIFKIKKDPRITKIGRFLRLYSLDELPQLLNVLKGDMSLVGPRPPTPDEVSCYNHSQMQRLSLRPGITGMSQVRGRSDLTFRRWVKWDLWYINNWSFGLDLLILLWTIPAVSKRKGAY